MLLLLLLLLRLLLLLLLLLLRLLLLLLPLLLLPLPLLLLLAHPLALALTHRRLRGRAPLLVLRAVALRRLVRPIQTPRPRGHRRTGARADNVAADGSARKEGPVVLHRATRSTPQSQRRRFKPLARREQHPLLCQGPHCDIPKSTRSGARHRSPKGLVNGVRQRKVRKWRGGDSSRR